MPKIIVLIGPQGAGKGTQAHMLSEAFKMPIVATGEMLREVARSENELGHKMRDTQAAGQLVSDEILARVVSERTSRDDCRNGYILDGYPRTLPQAQKLEEIAREQGHTIQVVKISVPRDHLFKRLTGRRTCSTCQATYNIYLKPSRREGVCDLDGGELFTRSDDNPEAIERRLALYDEKTRPLLDYYREAGRLQTVDGTLPPEEVFAALSSIVDPT